MSHKCQIKTCCFPFFCRLGAWQFLADMPFKSVSSETLWKLFLALHLEITKVDSVASIQREESMRDSWREVLESTLNETSIFFISKFLSRTVLSVICILKNSSLHWSLTAFLSFIKIQFFV